MKHYVRFRINAAGLQWFNPTEGKFLPIDPETLGRMLYNISSDWPVMD